MLVELFPRVNFIGQPSKLEFLSLKWAVTKSFQEYLYSNTFDVYSNNNPLTYVLT